MSVSTEGRLATRMHALRRMKKSRFMGVVTLLLVGGITAGVLMKKQPAPTQLASRDAVTRGELFDYSGKPLTGMETRWRAALNLDAIRRLDTVHAARFAADIAQQFGMGPELAQRIADRPKLREIQLPGHFSEQQVQTVQAWLQHSEWQGTPRLIRFLRKPMRTYPESAALAPVVGIVDVDGTGIEGLELQLNARLRTGAPVRISVEIDKQRSIANRLSEAIRNHGLVEANAVALELATGRLAAIVSLPSYDPADLPNRFGPRLRLKPVTDLFQPGPMLQPFLLYGVLSAESPEQTDLKRAFTAGHRNVGLAMAQALGYQRAMTALEHSGLLQPVDIDFPGAARALVRSRGTPDVLLRDIGNGAGVAPSLLTYSTSLATALTGTTRPTRLTKTFSQSEDDSVAAGSDAPSQLNAAAHVLALRTEMIKHARLRSGDPHADFGGMWASYRERAEDGPGTRRAAVALFAPAEEPRYLVAVTIRPGSGDLSADAVLEIGIDALRALLPPASVQRTAAASVMSRRAAGHE